MRIVEEFAEFLKTYKVIGLAVAFVMGQATNEFIKALVSDLIMPLVNPLVNTGDWETSTHSIGSIVFKTGHFFSAFLNFFILAIIIFLLIKTFNNAINKTKKIKLKTKK